MTDARGWKRQFISDTVAGVCPEALLALQAANQAGFVSSYGEDEEFSHRARQLICQLFDKDELDCKVFFVGSGTAANALAVSAGCRSFDGIICHPMSHLEHDEANAPEYLSGGAKLIHVDGPSGRMDCSRLQGLLHRGHGHHSVRMRMISVTQATELGTLYSLQDLDDLAKTKQEMEATLRKRYDSPDFRLYVHMDGARFANAAAALGCSPKELIKHVDVISLGGSKNGGPPTEAIVFFNTHLAQDFAWRLKQTGQLASKMRYLTAPWLGLLDSDVWLKNARQANTQAQQLGRRLQELGLELAVPVQINMVFVKLHPDRALALQQLGWEFYPFQLSDGLVYRFVCNWSTTDEAIDDLIADAKKC